ncbi:MAG: DHH family phosphoesterase [Promethearchaeota archaeon]|nr:MAG: DHH family phosphoesterase [Candidatus Lokiarchaeota archaeon]
MDIKPDRYTFKNKFEMAVSQFCDLSSQFQKVIAISHNDADGISSLHLIQNLLYRMNLSYDYFIYNRSVSWQNYLDGIFSQRNTEKTAFIFTDVGSNLNELIPIIRERNEKFFILDHHEVESDITLDQHPENLMFVNPTLYGFDGIDHIAGATLTYMFAKAIKPQIIKQGWLAVIGIAGDSLKPMDQLRSYNREIYEELVAEDVIKDREGLILFGGMHNSIRNGLRYSILPFVKQFGGDTSNSIENFLTNLGINPEKKVSKLTESEIQKIQEHGNFESYGNYAILPNKRGLLRYAFEYALLLNILCFKNISAAVSIIQLQNITRYAKKIYYNYISSLARNLKIISRKLPRFETDYAIFIRIQGKIPPSNWSDTASFSTVNELFNPYKIILLGGLERKSQTIKLSIRCTRKFLKRNNGIGVNKLISKIIKELGGTGGGHKLAGGLRLSRASYKRLKENIDGYISLLLEEAQS